MELADKVTVVTGGASGIGAALCHRFAEEGARAVVVVDVDHAGAQRVAGGIAADHPGTKVVAEQLDVADGPATTQLVDRLVAQFGGIDLYCANAGIATGAGVDAPDRVWQQAWDVNVMGHVHAATALLPHWLERGQGYLVTTASAAGLLTMVGDAPYSATKHAAVGLAEWLSITYGQRGITVSCLCPQGVRTPMLFGTGDGTASPDDGASLAAETVKAQGVVEPEEVAQAVVAAVRTGQFLVLPHPEVADYEAARATQRERWLGGMRKLAARIAGQ
jgi:NAD(P)-dependent dehydrogenase (short-subunit alcohol dehydrogenase family)